ncbi:FAD/NAD(P)-binding protein [Nocardia sp. R6R-6]|uniref:FAD/NAD(P)-binding protein n=1 Tax=Nocardia sp. R6R-6 TaxID=3459303 RepID=UPI00403DD25D
MNPSRDNNNRVVIIGGGPSGIAVFGALVRRGSVTSITIVDPNPVGLGNVYGDLFANDPVLLCNTPTGFMYLDDTARRDFLDYLVDRGWPVGLDDQVPRFLFGDYCRERFHTFRAEAERHGTTVTVVERRAESIRIEDDGYAVVLDNGEAVSATDIVLCIGMEIPKLAPLVQRFQGHPRLLRGSYPAARLRELAPNSHVLVLGVRSSAQDAITMLCRNGHTVTATSPSGRLSAVRDRCSVPDSAKLDRERWLSLHPDDPQIIEKVTLYLTEEVLAAGEGRSLEDQIVVEDSDTVQRLKAELAQALRGDTRWADLTYEGLFTLNSLVGPWPPEARAKLMPLAYPLLTHYVNALPVLTAQNLLANIEAGRAVIKDVFTRSIDADADGWTVVWADDSTERFDYVVSTSGFHFPRFISDGDAVIRLTHDGAIGDATVVGLTKDLRLQRQGHPAERIWAVGAACGQRYPFAHVIMLAAAQAPHVAAMLVDGAAGNVEEIAPTFGNGSRMAVAV